MFEGTSLQGHIIATYSELLEVFGQPDYLIQDLKELAPDDEDKVETEWEIMGNGFDDEIIPVRIYDWKCHDAGRTSRSGVEFQWHIGGNSYEATMYVYERLGAFREKTNQEIDNGKA